MSRRSEMSLGDFQFLAFGAGAKLIYKKLKDKRLTRNRFVSDYNMSNEDWAGNMWFTVPIGTKRSNSIKEWVDECNKLNCQWEIRQDGKKTYTIFLFCGGSKKWPYNKQVRSVNPGSEYLYVLDVEQY